MDCLATQDGSFIMDLLGHACMHGAHAIELKKRDLKLSVDTRSSTPADSTRLLFLIFRALPANKPSCVQGTNASLDLALRMLAEYDAVGVLERMSESFQLLEAVLPRWAILPPRCLAP